MSIFKWGLNGGVRRSDSLKNKIIDLLDKFVVDHALCNSSTYRNLGFASYILTIIHGKCQGCTIFKIVSKRTKCCI